MLDSNRADQVSFYYYNVSRLWDSHSSIYYYTETDPFAHRSCGCAVSTPYRRISEWVETYNS